MSVADRDGMVQNGMEEGTKQTYAKLDEVLQGNEIKKDMADNNKTAKPVTAISLTAARLAIAAAVLLLLASLHILSPEFDPSWRMVSEYANGHYGWVLSLMFASWAVRAC